MTTLAYVLEPGESLERGFRRLMMRMEKEAGGLEVSPAANEESVHQIRLLIKRLRALLWLVQDALKSKMVEKVKEDLRRAAGGLSAHRDLAVMRKVVEELEPKNEAHREKMDVMARGLKASQVEIPDEQHAEDLRAAMGLFLKAIKEMERGLATDAEWPDVGKRLEKATRAAKKAGKSALRSGDDAAFHDWRKKVKRLWYLLELMQGEAVLGPLRELQHVLGDYHDCVVTEEYLGRKTPGEVKVAVKLLRKKKADLRGKAEELFGK